MTGFPPNSRYYGVPLRVRIGPDGAEQRFVGRRIIPETERYRALDRYRCDGLERPDALAAHFYGDPLQYWRICDANCVADPAATARPEGRVLLIPLPLEVSGHGVA